MWRHLRNPRLLATYVVGFCIMFTLLGTFTYVNFYLAAPPFGLSTTALGLLFVVYLVGAVVTPTAGRAIDRFGHRFALVAAFTGGATGVCLTLVHSLPVVMVGLTLACTGVFIANSAGSSYVGSAATESRASAVGLYVTFYYLGGSGGSCNPRILLDAWRVAGVRRTDSRGAVGDHLPGADFLAAAAESDRRPGTDGGDRRGLARAARHVWGSLASCGRLLIGPPRP